MYTCVDKEVHGWRRRIVNQAFAAAAISSYEPIILNDIHQLCDSFLESSKTSWPLANASGWSSPKDLGSWSELFLFDSTEKILTQILSAMFLTLDILSDLTFAKSFNLITKYDLRWLVTALLNQRWRNTLGAIFPKVFQISSSTWSTPNKLTFSRTAEVQEHALEIFTKYSNEQNASPEKMTKRADILSVLLAVHDPKTGDKFQALKPGMRRR